MATFALYRWMQDDALIKIPAGTVAPGSGIGLPAEASTLLDTKGHIVVVQSQLTIPMGETVKVPFSVTWSSRSELLKEKDVRGQTHLQQALHQRLPGGSGKTATAEVDDVAKG